MSALKLTQLGEFLGVIPPKELAARLKLEKGDSVCLTELANGTVMLTRSDADFEVQLDAGRKIMKSRRRVLRELAR